MSKFTCLVLCAVTASLSSNNVTEIEPTTIEDLFAIVYDCAKKHEVSDSTLNEVGRTKNVALVKPCFWGCCLKKTGFMNQKGQYVLNPGLSYVRKVWKENEAYGSLETIYIIVKECESVKDKNVTDGVAGCEMGTLAAECFMKEYEKHTAYVDEA